MPWTGSACWSTMRYGNGAGQLENLLVRGFYSTAFQPIVEGTSGKSIGFESLLRGPEGSVLSEPGRIFNEQGFVTDEWRHRIDAASINAAVRTARLLPGKALIFINVLGATMLRLTQELEGFLGLLTELGIEPSRIVFEVSENTGLRMADQIAATLHRVQKAGIRVALDDIGVRSSYLYHLLCLEPEFIKLDRIFVQGIDRDKRKQDLVSCMAGMAETMGAQLIAEGIESCSEFRTMQAIGVPLLQGFYLGRPQPAKAWGDLPLCPAPGRPGNRAGYGRSADGCRRRQANAEIAGPPGCGRGAVREPELRGSLSCGARGREGGSVHGAYGALAGPDGTDTSRAFDRGAHS
jgi:EAL domain-containing protein (putative c-di-GMP-specific phosphodiesterase class I)